jgi:2-C-methyl-D-erythritol 4-phosphate cytidylyltransferase
MGAAVNKVYLPIAGVAILTRAAEAFARVRGIDELIVVAHPDELALAAQALPPFEVPVRVVAGGTERRDSALAGVGAAQGDLVLIHDAARPFPSRQLIERVIDGARRHGACFPAVPVVDTLRRVDAAGLASADPVPREGLVRVQTPQGFRIGLVRDALARWAPDAPLVDDAAAVLALGVPVAIGDGDAGNIKVTTPLDLELAERLARCSEIP